MMSYCGVSLFDSRIAQYLVALEIVRDIDESIEA